MSVRSQGSDKRHILIVDDEPGMRALFSFMLGVKGYDVHTAASGEEAIESMQEGRYDLIFLDMRMPYMDGLEVFRTLKTQHSDLAVIMMTGYAVEQQLNEALREGAKGYLRKPFTVDELLGAIDSVLLAA